MANSEQKKCAHPACSCIVADDKKYCSNYCEDASSEVEISCDCGHPGCALA
jgi:metallothionein